MDKVNINIKGDKAEVTEGKDSLLGKMLIANKGKVKLNTPRGKAVVDVVEKLPKKSLTKVTKSAKPATRKAVKKPAKKAAKKIKK